MCRSTLAAFAFLAGLSGRRSDPKLTEETLLAATSFAFVMAFTPGPNNIIRTTSC